MEKKVNKFADNEPTIQKSVNDLGIAAYLMMHGYKLAGRRNRTVFFEINASESQEFEKLCFEYLSSPYHQFDSNLMAIKKVGDYEPNR